MRCRYDSMRNQDCSQTDIASFRILYYRSNYPIKLFCFHQYCAEHTKLLKYQGIFCDPIFTKVIPLTELNKMVSIDILKLLGDI